MNGDGIKAGPTSSCSINLSFSKGNAQKLLVLFIIRWHETTISQSMFVAEMNAFGIYLTLWFKQMLFSTIYQSQQSLLSLSGQTQYYSPPILSCGWLVWMSKRHVAC
jgi:hypothetical protein